MTTSLAVTIVIRNGLVHAVYANDTDLDLVVVDWDVLPDDPHAISIHATGHTFTGVISRPNVESYTGFEQSHEGRLLGAAAAHSPTPKPCEPAPVRPLCPELTPRQITTLITALRWWQETTDDVDGHNEPPTSDQPLPHADIDTLCNLLAG
jgi:hypothetical protein